MAKKIPNVTIKVTKKTFDWIEDNRGGLPKTQFMETILTNNTTVTFSKDGKPKLKHG